MIQSLKNKGWAAAAVAMSVMTVLTGVASAEDPAPDQLESAVTSIQSQIVGYALPIGAALVAVGLAFVAVKLIPRVIRMVSARLG